MSGEQGFSGFKLILGHYLDNGWERSDFPNRVGVPCPNCGVTGLEVFKISKKFYAFDHLIVKSKTIRACHYCLHEHEVAGPVGQPTKKPAKAPTPLQIFKSLSKQQKDELISLMKKGRR